MHYISLPFFCHYIWKYSLSILTNYLSILTGLSESAIAAFRHSYGELVSGSTGCIPEDTISGVTSLPTLDTDIRGSIAQNPALLKQTVVLKLNGGLGTSMGLDKAKSLLSVKGTNSFLDLTAKQVLGMRKEFNVGVKFMLMNSFNTSKDTLDFFAEKYPSLAADPTLELMQNKVRACVCIDCIPCLVLSVIFPPINPMPHILFLRCQRLTRRPCSPRSGRPTPPWSGALPDTGTSTPPCTDPVRYMIQHCMRHA